MLHHIVRHPPCGSHQRRVYLQGRETMLDANFIGQLNDSTNHFRLCGLQGSAGFGGGMQAAHHPRGKQNQSEKNVTNHGVKFLRCSSDARKRAGDRNTIAPSR
jgi:hypothetical protein